jgi:two-component system response regulator YesN
MRTTSQRFPDLLCVVLTFHQELEQAQEAIRLGVIDYIAKVQLEKERFDQVLRRIRERFLQERTRGASVTAGEHFPEWFSSDTSYALLSVESEPQGEWIRMCAAGAEQCPYEISEGAWLWTPRECPAPSAVLARIQEEIAARDGWMLVFVSGLTGERSSRVHGLVRRYRQTGLFYDYDRGAPSIAKRLSELEDSGPKISDAEMDRLEGQWLAFEWVWDDTLFADLRSELKAARPSATTLFRLLVELENEWNRVYMPVLSNRLKARGSVRAWQEVESWLTHVRESALLCARKLSYAPDVVNSIMRAARIVDKEMGGPVFAVAIARRVGLSRSYFCQCFKDITGKSFNDYLRSMRMEKAKLMLAHTDAQIYHIAEQVGYTDEKYFSRSFRAQTGTLPSEFRQQSRAGRHPS